MSGLRVLTNAQAHRESWVGAEQVLRRRKGAEPTADRPTDRPTDRPQRNHNEPATPARAMVQEVPERLLATYRFAICSRILARASCAGVCASSTVLMALGLSEASSIRVFCVLASLFAAGVLQPAWRQAWFGSRGQSHCRAHIGCRCPLEPRAVHLLN